MIIQTLRSSGFAAVLRGDVHATSKLSDGSIVLHCKGNKRETGEVYVFRVVLSEAELQSLVQDNIRGFAMEDTDV